MDREVVALCVLCRAPLAIQAPPEVSVLRCGGSRHVYAVRNGIVVLVEADRPEDYPAEAYDLLASVEPRHVWFEGRNRNDSAGPSGSVGKSRRALCPGTRLRDRLCAVRLGAGGNAGDGRGYASGGDSCMPASACAVAWLKAGVLIFLSQTASTLSSSATSSSISRTMSQP